MGRFKACILIEECTMSMEYFIDIVLLVVFLFIANHYTLL